MKMEIKKEFGQFKDWIKVIRTILEEQTIEAREDGLHALGMDPSHVAMIKTAFRKELFDSYEVGEDDKVTVNIKELYKILDRIDEKTERVVIEHDKEQAKLLITTTKGNRIRQFKAPVLEDYDAELPEPKIFFKSKCRIVRDEFDLGLSDAQLVSEHVVISMTEAFVKIEGMGDMGDSLAQWNDGSDDLLELASKEEAKATFTLTYLMDIVKAVKPLSEVLTIELTTDMPIRIEAETPGYIPIEFFLAPCIGV